MTQTKNNIHSHKGKHLSYTERCQIVALKKKNYSNRQNFEVLVPQIINNEIKRGTIIQLKRKK